MTSDKIVVRSHVGRDLLQSAGLFKSDRLVVWEYVANSLQYVDAGVSPIVRVALNSKSKQITITDNGRGMDREALQHFFFMHGENLDRKAGQKGRGRFGTGKSAAFGIADSLLVQSVRNHKRNTVQLHRRAVDQAGGGDIPVTAIEIDVPTTGPNGTTIQISGIRLKSLDQRAIIAYVERHLARWPSKPVVLIDNHVCEPPNPPIASERKAVPSGTLAGLLGNVELIIKVAKAPLEPELQGINVFANGVWLETTLAGSENQAMAHYIFGEIDVPALDDDSSPIAAYDMSRGMSLNRNNQVVVALLEFIGPEIETVRRQLVKEDHTRRAQQDAKALAREASRIAALINEDFSEFSNRVAKVRAISGKGRDAGPGSISAGSDLDTLTESGQIPGSFLRDDDDGGGGNGDGGEGNEPPTRRSILNPDPDGDQSGSPVGGSGHTRQPTGGFRVDFKGMTAQEARAKYARAERTIWINLDHPQIAAARGSGSTDDPVFRRLVYEVAFSEYAIALAYEFDKQGDFLEASDAIEDIRGTLNRMATRAASLYSQQPT